MKIKRTIVAFSMLLAATCTALAQHYPSRPIKIVSGFATGGVTSTIARLLADGLSKQLNQPVMVEDKPGASGVIGARAAMAAPADGYTLHIGGLNPHPLLVKNGIDLLNEMEPIGLAVDLPQLFITTAAKPLGTVAEVIAFAKANPGRLDFASTAGGAELGLIMALFANRAGITFTNVPFRSAGEIQTALGRGDVHVALLSASSSAALITGKLASPVFFGAPERLPLYPDVPTPSDLGFKPFTSNALIGLWTPKGTPVEVVKKLSAATMAAQRDPAYIEAVKARTGIAPTALTSEQTRALFASKIAEHQEAIRLTGFKPE